VIYTLHVTVNVSSGRKVTSVVPLVRIYLLLKRG